MKVLICLVILFTYGSCQSLSWEDYKTRFSKTFTPSEDSQRKGNFNNQQKIIIDHNKLYAAGTQTYDLNYNPLTDAGFVNAFEKCFKLISWASDFPKGSPIVVNTENLPPSFELQTSRVLVIDQTNNGNWNYMKCNYGWASAVAKAVEIFGINNSKDPSTISLSPQQLIDCWNGDNCLKGIPHKAMEYLIDFEQVLYPEENYKFIGQKKDFCTPNLMGYPGSGSLKGFTVLDDKATEDQIKGVLVNKKTPIIFEIDPYNERFLNYNSGVYTLQTPINTHSHFMLIVGYGKETINGQDYPYWKTLNSWGESWGEKGYMKLLRTKANIKKFVFPTEL